jgi:uncharacterized protein (TIGR03118 family)
MKKIFVKTVNLYFVILLALLAATGCQKNIEQPVTNSTDATSQSNAANERRLKGNFQQVNFSSDAASIAQFNPLRGSVDGQNIANAWGFAFVDPVAPGLPRVVVVANGPGLGNPFNVTNPDEVIPCFTIPWLGTPFHGGKPTGLAMTTDFVSPYANPVNTIFVGEDGFISGGTPYGVFIAVDNSSTAVYTGVAVANDGAPFMYAANVKTKTIDVFDGNFQQVYNKPFKDPSIPPDYTPFNIQNINNNLFVMYAKTIPGSTDIQNGQGLGYIDIFRPDGTLLTSFAKGGVLNAPWGCTMAPASWTNIKWDGDSSATNNGPKNHIKNVQSVMLIGNSGDGYINAFNQDGQFLGRLRSGKKAITIDGLKGISFAPAAITRATTVSPDWLFFAAGPDHGQHGLFGYLQPQ